MKKYVVFLIIMLTVFSCCTCFAQEEKSEASKLEEKASDTYEFFSLPKLFEIAKDAVTQALKPSFPVFFGLLGIILICAVMNAFDINFGGFDIGGYVSAVCISGYCFSVIKSLCESIAIYIEKLRNIMLLITPTLISASAGDGVSGAKQGYTGLTVTLTVAEFLVTELAIPCVKILFALSLVSCMCRNCVDLKGIFSSIKSFAIFSVSLIMTAVVTVMHFQNIIARAVDCVGLRAVKFASSSFIPIVGSLVGESVKTVTEALRAVRGITGMSGVAAIIAACLPPIAAIVVYKTEISVCTCLAKTLGCHTESGILSDINGLLNILNAALLASSVGFSAMICIVACAV